MGIESAGGEQPFIPFDEDEQYSMPAHDGAQEALDQTENALEYPPIIDTEKQHDYTFVLNEPSDPALYEPLADTIPSSDFIPQLDDENIAKLQEAMRTLGPRYSSRKIGIATGDQPETPSNSPDATPNDEQ
jgi:hypothetical protein